MSATQHGLRCDVCGDYITLDPTFERFGVAGIEGELHCHVRCRPSVERMSAAKDWRLLPCGPLREFYAESEARNAT